MLLTQTSRKPHRTKEEYVYDTLRTAIMRCQLVPGQKLVLDNLSSELGVSPIPIRSALQRLEAEGLVNITPHTGTHVSELSSEIVSEIFLILESLETAAFKVAVTKATPSDHSQLENLVEYMAQALSDANADRWYDLNNQFHLTIAQICQMKMLHRFTSHALDSRDRLRYFYSEPFISARMAKAHAEHGQMIKFLREKNSQALADVAAQHNRSALEAYHKLIESRPKDTLHSGNNAHQ
ncbi:MAG: GntR family transcriptional regulator [Anaerolineae bacterium]|nr:GntR family transcriptional regulator [Anaerolineae bacterium]